MPASAVVTEGQRVDGLALDVATRLLVTWRHPETRAYQAVGVLERLGDAYEFAYLGRAREVEGFRPFLGFSDLSRRYRSNHLFPIFRERLMSVARPDLQDWLAALALDAGASELELLARSGGTRAGDAIELIAQPDVFPDGATASVFLVHGVRHQDGAGDRITNLRMGERLLLVDDPQNQINSRAVLVSAQDQRPLGWVPDPLLEYVRHVRDSGNCTLRVVRANGPEVGPRLRLLVRLEGRLGSVYRPFTGPAWQTLA